MARTAREDQILRQWPVVTETDIERMNDEFRHYIFFRTGKEGTEFFASCCGHKETIPAIRRTEFPRENALLYACRHNETYTCPWCGRKVTMKDLAKSGKRKMLKESHLVVLLHGDDDALYADAVCLQKKYDTPKALTQKPEYWLSSSYYFTPGEVMQVDYQCFDDRGVITWERARLGKKKLVQEPFKRGYISYYSHESYAVINREVLEQHPHFRYCQYFHEWQYRPFGPRGYAHCYHDLISYLTAYCMYPRQIEMMVKSGLYQPVVELLYNRKKFALAINWEEPDIRRAMGLSKAELRQVLVFHPDFGALECLAYARKHFGVSWDVEDSMTFWNMWGVRMPPMNILRFCRRYQLQPERLIRYLARVTCDAENPMAMSEAFELYRDYLDAAYHIGLCMTHTKVLWPEALFTAHDQAVARWAGLQAAEELRAGRGKAAKNGAARKLKYEFELDGLRIIFPVTAAAIRAEGKALDHCVGGYADRHVQGVLTILFLRKSSAPDVPYVTIEMRDNQLQQIHGYHNDLGRVSPRVTHKDFLDAWLRWLRAGSKRNEDGTPKLPKRSKAVTDGSEARTA